MPKTVQGKPRILEILAGRDQPDNGQVTYRKGLKLGYLPQDPELMEDSEHSR